MTPHHYVSDMASRDPCCAVCNEEDDHKIHRQRRKADRHARVILDVVDSVELRCMAADGPVTPTLQEITEAELRRLWRAARAIAREVRE